MQGWVSLPLSWLDNFTGNYTFNYGYQTTPGKITFHFFFAKVAGNVTPDLNAFVVPTIRVKVVLIGSKLAMDPERLKALQKLSYGEAQSLLHFKD